MKKLILLLLVLVMAFSLIACGKENPTTPDVADPTAPVTDNADSDPVEPTETPEIPTSTITADRQGNPITLPAQIDKIITFGAANAEILAGLGSADKIIAVDMWTTEVEGLTEGLPQFDMGAPDVEAIISLAPDVMILTGMIQTQGSGDDMYKPFYDAGICVIYIPSSVSIDGIREDIRFLGEVVGKTAEAEAIIAEMDTKIAEVKAIGDTITEQKTVFFDLGSLYSFGTDNFLNEMLELIGAKNIFEGQTGWIAANDESILAANPDVILTSVNYMPDPVMDIMSRPGWSAVTAVANFDVYYVDANASNRPSQNIVKALEEMAQYIYPDHYDFFTYE